VLIGPADTGLIAVFPQHFAKDLFAFAVSVRPRRVEKIATQLNRAMQ
jgi:hypothetical protein